MHVSAERIAIADRAVRQTVEQVGVAWSSVPRWDTGDPGQVLVRSDVTGTPTTADGQDDRDDATDGPFGSTPLRLGTAHVPFRITLAQAASSTPDALLAAVGPRAERLAREIDETVLGRLAEVHGTDESDWYRELDPAGSADNSGGTGKKPAGAAEKPGPTPGTLLAGLLDGREVLEDSGYRAPSCLIAGRLFFRALHRAVDRVVLEDLLAAANVNSLHRSRQLDGPDGGVMLMLARRQQIAHGNACSASPGEEPVDLAVAVPPSLEVVGENAAGGIDLAVRVRFATRVKNPRGVVVFHT